MISKQLTLILICLGSFTVMGQREVNLMPILKTHYFGQDFTDDKKTNCSGFEIGFQNIDTIKQIADIRLDFYFSNKAIKIFVQDFKINGKIMLPIPKAIKSKCRNCNTIFCLEGVKFIWDSNKRSYINKDTLIGLIINDVKLDVQVHGLIELKPYFINGWRLDLIISSLNDFNLNYYYFSYYDDCRLLSISSNDKYNAFLVESKQKKRELKGNEKLKPYYYGIAAHSKRNYFMNLRNEK